MIILMFIQLSDTLLLGSNMSEEYKLTYFDVRGRGEPIRMLLTLAGQKFDDVKVGHVEWPTMKPSK